MWLTPLDTDCISVDTVGLTAPGHATWQPTVVWPAGPHCETKSAN